MYLEANERCQTIPGLVYVAMHSVRDLARWSLYVRVGPNYCIASKIIPTTLHVRVQVWLRVFMLASCVCGRACARGHVVGKANLLQGMRAQL